MTPPAYHLRTNKAIDRLMLIEAIRRIAQPKEMAEFTYYGFGGPYLEDFRLLHENFPSMKMISIEKNLDVYKRQVFHLPTAHIKLKKLELRSFLTNYDSSDRKSIFWLDYTGLEFSQFEDFMQLLTKVASGSVIKITLRSNPRDYFDKQDKFNERFGAVLPRNNTVPPADLEGFSSLLQEMLQIASQQALPSGMRVAFQPITSFFYKDGAGIFTLTGVVCDRIDRKKIKSQFEGWSFANLHWAKPQKINVPFLSIKERLHLQQHLPCKSDRGRSLIRILGYHIDSNKSSTIEQMKQYADFYLQYPQFIRAYL